MIGPITVTFDTKAATDALEKLAQAAIARPELAQGIAKLSDQLFECRADYENFHSNDPQRMKIEILPSGTFLAFLRSIKIADGDARVAPPFDALGK
jgi:hypothetical protein